MLVARDLMTEAPATVRSTSTVRNALELLRTLDVRHLPVVNDSRELIGMLSDRDLRVFDVPSLAESALDARVSSVMSSDVLSVEEEADAAEIIDLMLDYKIGAVPVTDADGALVGIVSYMDLLRALPLEDRAAQ